MWKYALLIVLVQDNTELDIEWIKFHVCENVIYFLKACKFSIFNFSLIIIFQCKATVAWDFQIYLVVSFLLKLKLIKLISIAWHVFWKLCCTPNIKKCPEDLQVLRINFVVEFIGFYFIVPFFKRRNVKEL